MPIKNKKISLGSKLNNTNTVHQGITSWPHVSKFSKVKIWIFSCSPVPLTVPFLKAPFKIPGLQRLTESRGRATKSHLERCKSLTSRTNINVPRLAQGIVHGLQWDGLKRRGCGRSRVAPARFIPGLGAHRAGQAVLKGTPEKREVEFILGPETPPFLCTYPTPTKYLNPYSQNFTSKAWVAEPTNGWALKSTLKSTRPRPCSRLKNVEALGVRLRHWHVKYLPRDSNSLLSPKNDCMETENQLPGTECPLLLCFWEGKSRWWCEAKTTANAFVAFFYYVFNW